MSPTSSQQWTRRIRYSDQQMRVSDADRNAVTERLATHYSDGRLDQAEFDERVSRAMSAKTRGDLDGLFDDLPDTEPTGPAGNGGQAVPYRARRRGRGLGRTILLVILAIVALNIIGHAIAAVAFFTFAFSWFWVAALAVIVLVAAKCSRHRHHDR
jgi:hypothetical protein